MKEKNGNKNERKIAKSRQRDAYGGEEEGRLVVELEAISQCNMTATNKTRLRTEPYVKEADGWMDGWMDGGMDGWRDGWMDGWRDGWMDGWRDG